jgi:cyclopropane-fatty-acyl-phospholipid synthase
MDRVLQVVLRSFIRRGSLRVTTARGTTFELGDGTGAPVAVRFTTRSAEGAILLDPELAVGESYMNGTLVIERGSIAAFLALAMSQWTHASRPRLWMRAQWLVRYVWRRLAQFNPPARSRNNVAHHYDLDQRLYALFLDADRQYSCAYFEYPEQSLDDAQLAKKRHIAAKLLVPPMARVLDIGCGWGGLALYLAETCGARVAGITLSHEQLALARNRADERGLAGKVEFRLQDYRNLAEQFDRIVSVGMFEHVGISHYDAFFGRCAQVLSDDGVMLLHSIGRSEGAGITNPWIAKYIFPGGYIPALSEVIPAIERSGLLVTDIENSAAALCRDAAALARTVPRAP